MVTNSEKLYARTHYLNFGTTFRPSARDQNRPGATESANPTLGERRECRRYSLVGTILSGPITTSAKKICADAREKGRCAVH